MSSNISAAKAEASPNIAALKKLTDVETAEASSIPYDQEEVNGLIHYQPFKAQTSTTLIGFSENPTPAESNRVTKFIEKLPGKLPSSPPRRTSVPLNIFCKNLLREMDISTPPEMLGQVHWKGNDCPKDEGNTRDLDSDLQVGTSAHSIRNPANEDGILTLSTPTVTSMEPCTAGKLLEESKIHSQLQKLQKLIEIPEVDTEKSVLSSKTTKCNHHEVDEVPETQLLSDSLKECSQPYAIKWEDPVNVRRVAKVGTSAHSIRNPAHEDGIPTCSTPTTSAPCAPRGLLKAVGRPIPLRDTTNCNRDPLLPGRLRRFTLLELEVIYAMGLKYTDKNGNVSWLKAGKDSELMKILDEHNMKSSEMTKVYYELKRANYALKSTHSKNRQ